MECYDFDELWTINLETRYVRNQISDISRSCFLSFGLVQFGPESELGSEPGSGLGSVTIANVFEGRKCHKYENPKRIILSAYVRKSGAPFI